MAIVGRFVRQGQDKRDAHANEYVLKRAGSFWQKGKQHFRAQKGPNGSRRKTSKTSPGERRKTFKTEACVRISQDIPKTWVCLKLPRGVRRKTFKTTVADGAS